MKRLTAALLVITLLYSCSDNTGKGRFTVNGEVKGAAGKKIFLEELYFGDKPVEVLDTGVVKDDKFTVSAIAKEEGLYRLRVENSDNAYMFINDGKEVTFKADLSRNDLPSYSFSGAANAALKQSMAQMDSVGKVLNAKGQLLNNLVKSGALATDSVVMALDKEYRSLSQNFTNYCFAFADTAKSPIASLFVVTMSPVEITRFEQPLAKLTSRFPKHKGIETFAGFIRNRIAQLNNQQAPPSAQARPGIGSMAPDITMNDVNDKPFSLSQLKGKYVLVDFWASWCAPCRDENPNVVAAYNQFRDKNFTVLGVSLDRNKTAWLEAIKEDKLEWQHISDLKYWSSAAVPLYGFDGIPYNVLVDPQGKIIATELRGNALHDKLTEVLK